MHGASMGFSTSTKDSLNNMQRVHHQTRSQDPASKFDFSRIVKSIMANPFVNTGMNEQT